MKKTEGKMKILIGGASGLVGSALKTALIQQGHDVAVLVRQKAKSDGAGQIYWNPAMQEIDASQLEGFDVVINLAGESLSNGFWTAKKKAAILNSRIDATKLLCKTFMQLKSPPKVFINASAIGYYGDRGDEIVDENSAPGTGFLADVCKEWEAATYHAVPKATRTVLVRIGVVLDGKGGALSKMLTPFRLGLGGTLGGGKQYVSWIEISDLVRLILFAIDKEEIAGPLNAVSPHPSTNRELTKSLGKQLNRPTFFAVPAFAIKLLFGEMGTELLLSSTRVAPNKLLKAGFEFSYPDLEKALYSALKKNID